MEQETAKQRECNRRHLDEMHKYIERYTKLSNDYFLCEERARSLDLKCRDYALQLEALHEKNVNKKRKTEAMSEETENLQENQPPYAKPHYRCPSLSYAALSARFPLSVQSCPSHRPIPCPSTTALPNHGLDATSLLPALFPSSSFLSFCYFYS
eukprot:2920190-Pleurochrysis_carterae.AAC.1